jgi:KDO2-lipid IV(A) lauroyltransferase
MKLARLSMQHLCFGFFEFGLMPLMDEKWLQERAVFHGLDNYEKALSQEKGVLLLSLHVGNGDLGSAAMTLKGIRFQLISKVFKNPIVNEFWFGVRRKMGTRFLEPHGKSLAFDILKAMKKNEGVIFVIDQFMGRPYGIKTTFFGKKTGSPYGLSVFALKTGAPVVPVYTYRDEELKTHVVFEQALEIDPEEDGATQNNQDKDLQIQRLTQKYNDRVESIVRAHPEQWMWVHRRWKLWE